MARNDPGVQRAILAERRPLALESWRARWASGAAIDPIEGLWYGDSLEVAIVPDTLVGHFVAIVTNPDTAGWQDGMVRARLVRRAEGRYDVVMSARNHHERPLEAHLVREALLRMRPLRWGKREPFPTGGFPLDPADPRAPTGSSSTCGGTKAAARRRRSRWRRTCSPRTRGMNAHRSWRSGARGCLPPRRTRRTRSA